MTTTTRHDADEDYELEPSFPVDPDAPEVESVRRLLSLNRQTAVSLDTTLEVSPPSGKERLPELMVGTNPEQQGKLIFKVIWQGTGKRNTLYTVPAHLVILEEEELPFVIATKMPDGPIDITKRD